MVLALAACGGSDPIATYQQRGDAVCRASNQAAMRLAQRLRAHDLDAAEYEAARRRLYARFVAAIATVHPPSSLGDAHTRLLADLRAPPPAPKRFARQEFLAAARTLLADYQENRLSACAAPIRAELSQYLGHPVS